MPPIVWSNIIIILETQLFKEYLNRFLALKFSGVCKANWTCYFYRIFLKYNLFLKISTHLNVTSLTFNWVTFFLMLFTFVFFFLFKEWTYPMRREMQVSQPFCLLRQPNLTKDLTLLWLLCWLIICRFITNYF